MAPKTLISGLLGLAVANAEDAQGSHWAVIAAGSSTWMNYRHQADACHAYQIMKESGIPEDQIILMMQDDVAGSNENPFPGQLFNKPGDDSPDVYDGCKVDYKGSVVTADLFISVITGDAEKANQLSNGASSKVLKSGPNDRVFLNFADHGGPGIIAFPNGPFLHASDLGKALDTMQEKKMYKELLFYMEACESGSMFPTLKDDSKIFAVTAANAQESSWGYYCPGNSTVRGKEIDTCLGDLFSISWMEDSDNIKALKSETIQEQVKRVTARTTKSHVTQFGDLSFETEDAGDIILQSSKEVVPVATDSDKSALDVRDIELHLAMNAFKKASLSGSRNEKEVAEQRLQAVVAQRKADEDLFTSFAAQVCAKGGLGCSYGILNAMRPMTDMSCHKSLATAVHEHCPKRSRADTGGWNGFNMKFSRTLVNACEGKEQLQLDAEGLENILKSLCTTAAKEPHQAEILV